MKGDKILLLWKPKNKEVRLREPSTKLEFVDESGDMQVYRHYKVNDRWEIEVDKPLASFLLSRMPNDYHLLSPNSLSMSIPAGVGIGVLKKVTVKSIEQIAIDRKEAREKEAKVKKEMSKRKKPKAK